MSKLLESNWDSSAEMKAVFSHKSNGIYDDIKGKQYHFPRQYLAKVQSALNDWIIYYEEIPGKRGCYYTGVARVQHIRDDHIKPGHYYADLVDYIDFDRLVPYRESGGYERRLIRENGSVNGGLAVQEQ